MPQVHKKFTDEQVKELLEKYLKGKVERKYLQEIIRIGKSRFFVLVVLIQRLHFLAFFSPFAKGGFVSLPLLSIFG